jgi:hypothetical protein
MAPRVECRPVAELLERAAAHRARERGEGATFPVPCDGGVAARTVTVLYYYQPGRQLVYPPHFRLDFDAVTGELAAAGPVTPADFGSDQAPDAPVDGFGLDPALTGDEFRQYHRQLEYLSPHVWLLYFLYAQEELDPVFLDLVRRYREVFARVAFAPLLEYYTVVASEYFAWLERVAPRAP